MNYKKITSIFLGGIVLASGLAINNKTISSIDNANTSNMYNKISKVDGDDIEIWVPWAENGVQWNALSDVVDFWNENKAEDKGFGVNLQAISGGYPGLTSQIQQDIEAGSVGIQQLPDIYVNYPDTTSNLLQSADRNLAVDLSDSSLSSDAIDSDIFIPGSTIDASLIAGSENDEALYSIPMAMSSEMMAIDVPLFIWMLQQFQEQGGVVTYSGETMQGVFDSAVDGAKNDSIADADVSTIVLDDIVVNSNDVDKIESFWSPTSVDLTGKTLDITDDIFSSAEGLLELSNTLLLGVKDKNNDLNRDASQGMFGYDSIANNFYIYGQQITQSYTTPENGLLSIQKDNTNPKNDEVLINMIENDEEGNPTLAQEAAKEIYDFFIAGFESGAIWATNSDYGYGSDQFKNHQLLFSIGSTAGAAYYYTETEVDGVDNSSFVNPEDVYYTQTPGHFKKDETTKPVRMSQGPVFGAIDKGDEQGVENSIAFLSWLIGDESGTIGTESDITPSDYLSLKSGYIVGTNSVLSDSSKFSNSLSLGQKTEANSEGNQTYGENKYSIGPMIAKQNFIEAQDEKSELEVEPYGLFTSAFRSEIETQIKVNNVKVLQGAQADSSDDFIETLHNDAVRNAWTSGDIWGQRETMAWWAILLIALGSLLVIGLFGFLVYYFVFKNKNTL